jgi:hypothetical protein
MTFVRAVAPVFVAIAFCALTQACVSKPAGGMNAAPSLGGSATPAPSKPESADTMSQQTRDEIARRLSNECTFRGVPKNSSPDNWVCTSRTGGLSRELTREEKEYLKYGSLTKYEIEDEIWATLKFVKSCYDSFVSQPNIKAHAASGRETRINTNFIITKEGTVEKTAAAFRPDAENPLLSSPEAAVLLKCVEGVQKTYVFTKPRGGGVVSVKYPFVFNAK